MLFTNADKFKKRFDAVFTESKDIEMALEAIKKDGASALESVMVVKEILDIPLGEADEIVLFSKTWIEERDFNIKFRNDFVGYLEGEKKETVTNNYNNECNNKNLED